MKIVLGIVAVAALFIPGGQAFTAAVFTSLGASAAVAASLTIAVGWGLVGVALSSLSSIFAPTAKKAVEANALAEQRLNKSVVPEAARKIVFGQTAVPLDVRYWETYGTDNNNYDEVYAVASHEIDSFGDFHLEDKLHTFDGSGNSNILGSAFKRFTRTVGVTGTTLSAGAGAKWTSSSSLTGCAFMVLKYVQSQDKWPQGFPTRLTQEAKGALVYDPRLDSTNGGAGTHRIDNQATWEYNDGVTDIGRNPALQLLWYLIGWRINGTLVAGMGVDISSLDLQGFVQAANDAEASNFLCDCALSVGDDHAKNIGVIEASCGGRLMDTGGLYTFHIAIDDTANVAVAFDEDDFGGGFTWTPHKKMRDQVNQIAGKFVDPDALYQFRPMPIVENAAYTLDDGYERRLNNMYASVQDADQAQRLARIELNHTRYQGIFTAAFNYKALQAKNWSIVTLSFAHYGWVNKLFRIIEYSVTTKGLIILTLEETDSSIYTVVASTPVDLPGIGTAYDPRAKINVAGLTVTPETVVGDDVEAQNGLGVSFTAPSPLIKRTEIQYKVSSDSTYVSGPTLYSAENQVRIAPLTALTSYDVRARHVTIDDLEGDWISASATVTLDASAYNWSNVTGTGIPADNADVTYDVISFPNLTLINTDGFLTIRGNSVEKTGSVDAWDASVTSEVEMHGSASLSFKAGIVGENVMFGLSVDPTTGISFTDVDYAFYVRFDNMLRVYENGTYVSSDIAYDLTTVMQIIWDGVSVKYYVDGALFWTSTNPPSADSSLRIDSSFNTVDGHIVDIAIEQGSTVLGDPISMTENLLGPDAGLEQGNSYLYLDDYPIASFGGEVGDVISASALLTSTYAPNFNFRIQIVFYDVGDAVVSTFNGNAVSGIQTDAISKVDGAEIPATTTSLRVWITLQAGSGSTVSGRNAMLNRGLTANPFTNRVIEGQGTLATSRNIPSSFNIDQGGGVLRKQPFGMIDGYAFDGVGVTYSRSYAVAPIVKFYGGGRTTHTSLSGDLFQDFKTSASSASGFTPDLKVKELVGGTTTTNTTSTAVDTGTQDWELENNASGGSAGAWDNSYIFNVDCTVYPDSYFDVDLKQIVYTQGWVDVELFIWTGVWTSIGTGRVYGDPVPVSGSPETILGETITRSGAGLVARVGTEFGASYSTSANGGSVDDINSVTFDVATAPASQDASAGTSGIPYIVMDGLE